jgi:hypothetical protein
LIGSLKEKDFQTQGRVKIQINERIKEKDFQTQGRVKIHEINERIKARKELLDLQ